MNIKDIGLISLIVLLAWIMISCSVNEPSGVKDYYANISGTRYTFTGDGKIDSNSIINGNIPSLSYPSQFYNDCTPPAENIMTTFPDNLMKMRIYEDSTADFMGKRCSLLTQDTVIAMNYYSEKVPAQITIYGNCYKVGTSSMKILTTNSDGLHYKWTYIEHHSLDTNRAFKMLTDWMLDAGLMRKDRPEFLDTLCYYYQYPESLNTYATSKTIGFQYIIPKIGDTLYLWKIAVLYK